MLLPRQIQGCHFWTAVALLSSDFLLGPRLSSFLCWLCRFARKLVPPSSSPTTVHIHVSRSAQASLSRQQLNKSVVTACVHMQALTVKQSHGKFSVSTYQSSRPPLVQLWASSSCHTAAKEIFQVRVRSSQSNRREHWKCKHFQEAMVGSVSQHSTVHPTVNLKFPHLGYYGNLSRQGQTFCTTCAKLNFS